MEERSLGGKKSLILELTISDKPFGEIFAYGDELWLFARIIALKAWRPSRLNGPSFSAALVVVRFSPMPLHITFSRYQ
jgi:hypothetical protein